jgi:hypothetical protein
MVFWGLSMYRIFYGILKEIDLIRVESTKWSGQSGRSNIFRYQVRSDKDRSTIHL